MKAAIYELPTQGAPMTKNLNNAVGDNMSPAYAANANSLTSSEEQSKLICTDPTAPFAPLHRLLNMHQAVKNNVDQLGKVGSCTQKLWFSFFFDGTGNNLDADEGILKHSNVARLFRTMPINGKNEGQYSFYIPGIGTYFKDIGDPGGTVRGLAFGHMGEERLVWAFKQFDAAMQKHIARAYNPTNAIIEINIAAFGFSRGAALARAFMQRFFKRCHAGAGGLRLKTGDYPVRLRFLGIFDTVASVGLPMASNTTPLATSVAGAKYAVASRLADGASLPLRPDHLAFAQGGKAGTDPAPGLYDGHATWGGELRIPDAVEAVRHFVAAHEIRNSFPLDSITVVEQGSFKKPAHFIESVYPGVHSDVGGSYRPGEGARSVSPNQKLGLIPLHHMYEAALACGVPLLAKMQWQKLNRDDFDMDDRVSTSFNYYLSQVKAALNLGAQFNAHMGLYYAWRFYAIRRKAAGDTRERQAVAHALEQSKAEAAALKKEIARLEADNNATRKQLSDAQRTRLRAKDRLVGESQKAWLAEAPKYDDAVKNASDKQDETQDALLRAQAKLDALPKPDSLQNYLDFYDQQLVKDAKSIYQRLHPAGRESKFTSIANVGNLRPHYRALITAYENEFIHNKGLQDEKLIDFFDSYVHDSLAGFAKDATLPSDPRVIYVGGDEKLKYAEQPSNDATVKTA